MFRLAFIATILGTSALAQWNLMPLPSSTHADAGRLILTRKFRLNFEGPVDGRLRAAGTRFSARIAQQTGIQAQTFGPPTLTVRVANPGNPVQALNEDESYTLKIDPTHAVIAAPNPLGAMHGLETFFQLIEKTGDGWSAPAVTIEDHPRFPWRGLHLDVSRHFMPLDVLRRNLDAMAAVKLNVFHWHLSDDQGFRVESKKFPKLQDMGSDGLFYTQDEVRSIIRYARERGIRVVPEFDIPGHASSWLVGYPELAAAPGPFEIVRKWGVFDPAMDPAKPEVYAFLDTFIGEMSTLFPDAYFHIGGDEVNGKQWKANSTDIPAFMAKQGLKTPADLQTYFNQQVLKIVTKHGKRMEGWDEILNPALPKDIVIQSWRGAKSLAEAARQGYQGILSSGYYLDHIESSSTLYSVDPMGGAADSLSAEQKKHILGGEVCMWAEYVSPETVDSRIWPRSATIAERFWSPAATRDVADMYRRLEAIDPELDALGLTHNSHYNSMLERIAGSSNIDQLKTLADVLEPGTLGLRHRVNPNYSQNTPLDRLVDAARPDPPVARRFNTLVDRYVANPADTAARDEIHKWLALWSHNDVKAPADAAAVSSLLARISSSHPTEADLALAQKPVGEVTIAVARAIAKFTHSEAR